ncbi:hypothetical protein IU459_27090 [Nocardia amamiensis]|uniref:Uncharacterized protein n=1 Tax=Nocardia amamiensis TaxID=404578 RepID=A0ABS0CX55_9NOCA|nr:hypothetical protein [Nocardia amamiensis]MBF6301182.1 hypothetical protein [Nocardia amamiensis]
MTVVAAMVTGDHVVMGADNASDHSGTFVYNQGKIARKQFSIYPEQLIIGASGNAAIVPTVTHNLTIESAPQPHADRDAVDSWAHQVAEAMTQILAEATPSVLDGNNIDGAILMAWRQHLWLVHAHNAIRPNNGIVAIGSGRDIALGSMHTSAANRADPVKAVDLAVRLAATYDSGCRLDESGPLIYTTAPD